MSAFYGTLVRDGERLDVEVEIVEQYDGSPAEDDPEYVRFADTARVLDGDPWTTAVSVDDALDLEQQYWDKRRNS